MIVFRIGTSRFRKLSARAVKPILRDQNGAGCKHAELIMNQQNVTEPKGARYLLDKLLSDSRLYRKSKDYKALLDFVARLRNFAPFNAMLLQVQKPGLS